MTNQSDKETPNLEVIVCGLQRSHVRWEVGHTNVMNSMFKLLCQLGFSTWFIELR